MILPRFLGSCGIAALVAAAFAWLDSSASILATGSLALPAAQTATSTPPLASREAAYRANNRGVALLEQFKPAEAADALREALKLDSSLALARINLAIALFNVPDLAAAEQEAKSAAAAAPEAPQPHYILGLIARGQGRNEDAKAAFRKLLALDPTDVGSQVNLGQLLLQERQYAAAIAAFRAAMAAEPYNATAVYNLGLALTRAGDRDEGQAMMERFRVMREGGYATLIGQTYPDQGRYAEAVVSTGAEPELADPAMPPARYVDSTTSGLGSPRAGAARRIPALGRKLGEPGLSESTRRELLGGLGGGLVLFDADRDGDLDLYVVGPEGQAFYRNDKGKLVDVTASAGLAPATPGTGAVAGDYDNDERPDLLVLRHGGVSLHRNDGDKGFSDVTAAAGLSSVAGTAISAAFVDADHDGDLDVFVSGLVDLGQAAKGRTFPDDFVAPPARLLQNAGNGTFKDVAEAAGLADARRALAVVPTDYDNRRDVDLLVVPYAEPLRLFRNLRDGTFKDAAEEVALRGGGASRCAAAADVDKDGFTDFLIGVSDGPDLLALSDGKGRFVTSPAPEGSSGTTAAQFLDYDNDGLLDLLTLSARGARLLRNLGGGFSDVSAAALPAQRADAADASLASGDLDGDGDTDVLLRLASGALRIWTNQGGTNRSLRVQLSGLVSNRSGVGSKVEARAGSLRQKLETYAATPAPAPADVVFGLGKRETADAVRVLWPAGVLQTEMAPPFAERGTAMAMAIKELDRKPSSCPYLFAWNGRRFEFVTDFMGGGEMGAWSGPGVWNQPVPEEYVRIRDDQLVAKDGRFELRVTNELEEALFVDRLRLLAVAHPADIELHPNEGLAGAPRPPFRLFAAANLRPPRSAVDDHGHDVLPRLLRTDRTWPDAFRLHRIRGYAEEHRLTLDLGQAGERTLLLLTGWTDYAFSSDNVAAHQAGLAMKPPAIEVEDASGRWHTAVADAGIPVGRPQTVVVDLTGKWRGPGRRIRIVTNMRIYWDQVRVADAVDLADERVALEPAAARLGERGFSAEVSPEGREPFGYDYDRVSQGSPWKVMAGSYTRTGDVRELVLDSDDMFVVSRPGDEISVSFDARGLSALRPGWRRTFLLHADGFSKEMDINSASPHTVEPLPFHAMSRYPYTRPESYPMTPERRAYLERYNTRRVLAPLPPLELAETVPARTKPAGSPAGSKETQP